MRTSFAFVAVGVPAILVLGGILFLFAGSVGEAFGTGARTLLSWGPILIAMGVVLFVASLLIRGQVRS